MGRFYLSACIFILTAPPLWAGTYIKSVSQSYTDKKDWFYNTVAIDQGKMRADIQGPNPFAGLLSGKKHLSANPPVATWTFLFDQNTSQVDLVIPSSKAAYELTGDDFSKIRAFLAPLVPQLQKALNDNPKMKKKDKAEFQKGKKMLARFLDYPSAPAASGVSINGYTCDKYVFRLQGKKRMDYWCLPPSAMPMDPLDHQTSMALIDLFLDIGGDFITAFGLDPEKIKNHPYLKTFPVCSISYDEKGRPKDCYRVLAVKSESFPPETFDIPSTYEKTDVLDLVKRLEKPKPGGQSTPAPGQASSSSPLLPAEGNSP